MAAYAASHLDEDLSLQALAGRAGLSAFHAHRVFLGTSGETPKQFTLRLRLDRAAALLLVTGNNVIDVALDCGFGSHEAFTRAFRKRFGMTPSAYRARGFAEGEKADAAGHAERIERIGPCLRLFRSDGRRNQRKPSMSYSISKKEIPAQPVLVVRRRVKPAEVSKTLADVLGHTFQHAQQNGVAVAGQPFTRYLEWGPGMWTIEAGFPVNAHSAAAPSENDIRADTLPGGLVATTTHTGPYDKLAEAHAAMQEWIESEGLTAHGAPWEVYVTDPADVPDPNEWKTDIFWPLAPPKAQRADVATKPVVYQVAGMDAVTVERDIPYQPANPALVMDIYRPPSSRPATRLPAVVFVIGYSDLGSEKMLGCKFKDVEAYVSWAKLAAASGLVGITYLNHDPVRDLEALMAYIRKNAASLGIDEKRIGIWSCSGNVPAALWLLMAANRPALKCAALLYGCTLDLDGSTGIAEAAKTWLFANPTAGRTVRDLASTVPLFIARAGRDSAEMNQTLDRFISHAIAANLPVSVANHPTGPHAFDVLDASATSREIIRQILGFLRDHLAA
jgi:AraC family transcriptional regulator